MTDDLTTETTEDAEREPWDPENDPDGYTREDVQPKDIYLDTLLTFLIGSNDQGGGSVGLTIQLNGSLVSGLAISRKAWLDATIASLTSAAGEGLGGPVGTVYNVINEKQLERYERRDSADLPTRRRDFIHMKDVRVTVGGANEFYELPLWRGSLDDVTGWSLGSWNLPGSAT